MSPLDYTSQGTLFSAQSQPTPGSLKPMYPHQIAALDQIKAALRQGYRRPMVCAPTGSGKTVLAAHIVAGARTKGKRVAFCVPTISLIDQTVERFAENGIDARDIGVIQADHEWARPDAPIQICSAQTLSRRELPHVDVVIIDEAHVRHKAYDTWMGLASPPAADNNSGYYPSGQDEEGDQAAKFEASGSVLSSAGHSPVFIGLSATPWARGLGKCYDVLIKPTTVQGLIDLGFLSPFRVWAPTHPDLSGVKTVAGDYHEGQLADRMSDPKIVGDVVETWLKRADGKSTLCFAVNRAHAKLIHAQFEKSGVASEYVDAFTPREERAEIGRRLMAGAVKVVVNIGTLTTGIDWDVRCISLVRPTKSEMLFQQIIGRGLRTVYADGHDLATPEGRVAAIAVGPKPNCLVLDHSDTHLRLGFVTDIDHDELDLGRDLKSAAKKKEADDLPMPRPCPMCSCLIAAAQIECPSCGHVSQPPINVAFEEGELGEITQGKRKGRRGESACAALASMPRGEVYAQILGYKTERNRSDGWAAHAYREIFGVWPRGLYVLPQPPSNLMRAFVRAKDIRWAKSQQAKRVNNEGPSHDQF